jgi:hypothetical protein
MLEGISVKMKGQDYIIPPLNFKSIRKLQPDIEALGTIVPGAAMTGDQIDTVMRVILTAMERNYPDLTAGELEDLVDLGNLKAIIDAILGVSGYGQGETGPGEDRSTGTLSTPT